MAEVYKKGIKIRVEYQATMRYYVYFDGYGHVQRVVSQTELQNTYAGDTERFLQACTASRPPEGPPGPAGHVGSLIFDTSEELEAFLETLGDEVEGFFCCHAESRPYNF